ncbi:hypothetical protein [Rhodosalinus sp.]|uniref:hypothetical protein n=1 Tax=Rhodosalinus sp. TaxID=2047741 RepID=UPI0035640DD6
MSSGPSRRPRRRWRARLRYWQRCIRRRLPPGTRLPVGLLLIVGGILGFLPVLGFWMIPLGVMVAATDVRPLWRRLRGRRS